MAYVYDSVELKGISDTFQCHSDFRYFSRPFRISYHAIGKWLFLMDVYRWSRGGIANPGTLSFIFCPLVILLSVPGIPLGHNAWFCLIMLPPSTMKFRGWMSAKKGVLNYHYFWPQANRDQFPRHRPKATVIHDSCFWALIQPLNFVIDGVCMNRRNHALHAGGMPGTATSSSILITCFWQFWRGPHDTKAALRQLLDRLKGHWRPSKIQCSGNTFWRRRERGKIGLTRRRNRRTWWDE